MPSGRVVEAAWARWTSCPRCCGLLGSRPPRGLPGRDLRPGARETAGRRAALRREPVRPAQLPLVEPARDHARRLEADPGRREPSCTTSPRTRSRRRTARRRTRSAWRACGGCCNAALARMARRATRARPAALSPVQEERLRSLGYVAGSGGGGALDEPGLPDPRTHVRVYERVQSAVQAEGARGGPALAELVRIAEHDPGQPVRAFLARQHGVSPRAAGAGGPGVLRARSSWSPTARRCGSTYGTAAARAGPPGGVRAAAPHRRRADRRPTTCALPPASPRR